jgi:Major Facilitator Superfamily
MLSSLIGGASNSFAIYLVSAVMLGVFFAMQSGTVDSIVYDTVLEETGGSDDFEARIGRVRVAGSIALVASALIGGMIAELSSPRVTYFATVPFVGLAMPALRRFREPTLHKKDEATPIPAQIATTYRTLVARSRLRPVIASMVLSSVLLQTLLEFGPLWLAALHAPAVLYGPQWAGQMAALGGGGALASRVRIAHRPTAGVVALGMLVASLTLTSVDNAVVVIVAQFVLALLLVLVGIFLTRQLHDAIPSTIRAGVSSGVGTLTWMGFLPLALVFGAVTNRTGPQSAGWIMVALTFAVALSIASLVRHRGTEV